MSLFVSSYANTKCYCVTDLSLHIFGCQTWHRCWYVVISDSVPRLVPRQLFFLYLFRKR